MSIFSTRLKKIRKINKLMQKDIADKLEINPLTYRRYEYGLREPNLEKLGKLCKILNVSSDYLLGLSDDPNSHKK